MEICVEVKLQVCMEKTEFGYTAFCEPLNIYAEGPTKKKADQNIREALSLFLETCMEMGTLHEVLTESGFNRKVHKAKAKASSPQLSCENMRILVHPAVMHAQQAHAH